MQKHRITPWLVASAAGLLLGGCVSPEQAREQVAVVDSSAGLDREESNWERPFWEQGGGESASRDAGNANGSAPASGGEVVANTGGRILTNLAVTGLSSRQSRALAQAAPDHGFRVVPRADLSEAMARSPECDDASSLACARALAVYAGTRMVITVEGDSEAVVADSSVGAIYPSVSLDTDDTTQALLDLARDKAAIAPWTLRAFRADDGRLYLSAGRANGLEQGMELTVHEPGTLVRAPNGQPINWRAGEAVGRVRVAELFGNSLAALNPVTGQRPTSEHDLILAE
jgi:hypothetical protein